MMGGVYVNRGWGLVMGGVYVNRGWVFFGSAERDRSRPDRSVPEDRSGQVGLPVRSLHPGPRRPYRWVYWFYW